MALEKYMERVIYEKRETFESDKEEAKYWHSIAYVQKQKLRMLEEEVESLRHQIIGLKSQLKDKAIKL